MRWGRSAGETGLADRKKDIQVNKSEGQADVPRVVFRSFVELFQHSISYL